VAAAPCIAALLGALDDGSSGGSSSAGGSSGGGGVVEVVVDGWNEGLAVEEQKVLESWRSLKPRVAAPR